MPSREPLDDLLDRWQVPPNPTSDLRGAVRHAVMRAETEQPRSWLERLEATFSRPSFAFTFVAACVLLGLFLAEGRVSRLHAAYGVQVARTYVQLIDPLLDVAPTSGATTPRAQ